MATGVCKSKNIITIEGRDLKTGSIPVINKWVNILMKRENKNDSKATLQVTADNNRILMIDQLVIQEEE